MGLFLACQQQGRWRCRGAGNQGLEVIAISQRRFTDSQNRCYETSRPLNEPRITVG